MSDEFSLPFVTKPHWMLLLFAAFLLLFHALLIRLFPISKRGWKKVDYIWLGVTAIGILGTAGTLRRTAAPGFVRLATSRAEGAYEFARSTVQALSGSHICIVFDPAASPRLWMEKEKAEYEATCAFGKATLARIPETMPADGSFPDIGDPPRVSAPMLREFIGAMQRTTKAYAPHRATLLAMRAEVDFSPLDEAVLFFSPLFVAVGLALRITKVTGELREADTELGGT